ncbi:unnamed protein product, partial [Laminaria digitata]
QGVAWDPIGRFIASIGEENQLLVWRVGGHWDVEAVISEPFAGCEDTLVRRISWSPDGQFLVATNSKDGDIHRAVVFLRGRWDQNPTSLVGHLQSTLVASFSPLIYRQSAPPAPATATAAPAPAPAVARTAVHHVVAVAGRDNVITVWLAAASRPVVILREVFQQPPSDLSWGADGYTLLVSGHDGTVVVLRLSEEELGVPLPEADRRAHLTKIYGKDAGVPGNLALALDGAPALVDNPRQLALEKARKEQRKARPTVATTASTAAAAARGSAGGGTGSQAGGAHGQGVLPARPLQVESRGKGGKRRIQPMLVSNGGDAASVTPLVLTTTAPPSAGREPRWDGAGGGPGVGMVSEGFGSGATAVDAGGSPRSGHKRPRVGGSGGGGGSGGHARHHAVGVRSREGAVVRLRSGGAVPVVSPPELMPRRGASGSLIRQIDGGGERRKGEGGDAFRPSPRLREASPSSRGGSAGGLSVGHGGGGAEGGGVLVMECSALDEDFRGLPARRYTVVTVSKGGREAWRDYVAGVATACCGNARVAAVGAEDGSVYLYDRNGVRSAPPLVVSPPVAYLECSDGPRPPPPPRRQGQLQGPENASAAASSGDFLMAISGDGEVFVWNLCTMTLAAKSSLAPLFRSVTSSLVPPRSSIASSAAASAAAAGGGGSGGAGGGEVSGKSPSGVSVSRAGVTAEGMPLVMLACPGGFGGSLQAFALHRGLGTWVRVADGR